MPSAPYPIMSQEPNEMLQQMQSLLDDLYQNRLGGANVGDVFQVGADDVFQLRYLAIGGLQKISGALSVKPNILRGVDSSFDGIFVKLKADYGISVDTDGLYLKLKTGGGLIVDSTGLSVSVAGATIRGFFDNTDLTAGVLTITHNKGLTAPYMVNVVIFNNSNQQVLPDLVTGAENSVAVDLSSYGAIAGTWGYEVI